MEISTEFQTPEVVCNHMASMVPYGHILEPTPGVGNLVQALSKVGKVMVPESDFWDFQIKAKERNWTFDSVVMNPPFSPMQEGFRYLEACMELSDTIVALLPWFIIINSERRTKKINDFGLVSVTHLPRKTFPGCRIQCCILEMKKGFSGETTLKHFTW